MGFKKIYGQKRAIAILQADFTKKRVSHAYLFYGPAGVGKFKTASVFAQLLNCEKPQGAAPCQRCLSCRKFISGNHPDLLVIVPDDLSLKIEQIRALQEKIYYKCYEGQCKVIIIREAQLMTLAAVNCLLKVLEEPPLKTVFILLTDNLEKLPVTVQSRCQLLPFAYLSEEIITKVLKEKGQEDFAALLGAQGSLGKALAMIEDNQAVLFWEKNLANFALIKTGIYYDLFAKAEELAQKREWGEMFLDWLLILYRYRLVQLVTRRKKQVDSLLDNVSEADKAGCFAALQEINETVVTLRKNGNRRLAWEVLLLKLRGVEQNRKGVALNG